MREGYIPLITNGVGGAERRFADIANAMIIEGYPIKIVAPARVSTELIAGSSLKAESVISLGDPEDSFARYLKTYYKWVRHLSSPELAFHYPLNPPPFIHFRKSHWVTASITDSTPPTGRFNPCKASLRNPTILSRAKRVDVLNPSVAKKLAEMYPWSESKLTITPNGTFVDPKNYRSADKRASVLLLSRMVPKVKGIEEFLDLIPQILQTINKDQQFTFCIEIAGSGSLENYVRGRVATLQAEGLSVEYLGFQDSATLLSGTAIVLSLQESNNYPSRVVAEALLSGCEVIIRDTGESRSFGNLRGITYISANLDPGQIAAAIADAYQALTKSPGGEPSFIRKSAKKAFSNSQVAHYMADIMNITTEEVDTYPVL